MVDQKTCEQIKALVSDKEIATKIIKADTFQEIKDIFTNNNIDISDADLEAMLDEVAKYIATNEESELSEKQLDTVSGGMGIVAGIVVTVLLVVGVPIGTLHLGKYLGRKWREFKEKLGIC